MSLEKQISSLVDSSNKLTDVVNNKIIDIDTKVKSVCVKFENWFENTNADEINGEGRFCVDINVNGNKDLFYPVYFVMSDVEELRLFITRGFNWNQSESDFNVSHIGSAQVSLRGESFPWGGNTNFLRTIINFQRYRQTVGNIGFYGWGEIKKLDPSGPDTDDNSPMVGYLSKELSSFHLRGGKLRYRITSNKRIEFSLYNDGDDVILNPDPVFNYSFIARTIGVDEIGIGDHDNNLGLSYISYKNKH